MDSEQIVSAAAEIIRTFEKKDKLLDLAWSTLTMVELIELLENATDTNKQDLTNQLNYYKAVVKRKLAELDISNELPF